MSPPTAYAAVDRTITVQASTMSATDIFWLSAWLFVALIALVWLTKPIRSAAPAEAGGAH